ncbi:proximal sequence element A Pbp45 [Musca autumnalis]|uniref:proximal sequence element A Pbp45 n=1 Tax=Musca autumnalis TaxID=221902 RepID=UPI003CED6B9E
MEGALYKDSHKLIEEFVSKGSFEFSSFCSVWKEQTFQYIYAIQSSVLELIQTTCTLFHMAKRAICANDEFGKYLSNTKGNEERNLLRRIGGIYLMYAIYFKQPTKEFVKISVSLETWREIVAFINSLKATRQMKYDEVRYIFWRLYKADAFRFTALDYCAGPELVNYDKIAEEHSAGEHTEVIRVSAKDKLLLVPEIQEDLKEMTAQEEKYNELKETITNSQKKQTSAALPPTEIFRNINSVLNSIKDILDGKADHVSETNENTTISTKRRYLKRKAAGIKEYDDDDDENSDKSTNESSWSGEDNEEENDSNQSTNVQQKKKQKGRRNRLQKAIEEDSTVDSSESDEDLVLNEASANESEDEDEMNETDSFGASTSKVLLEDCKLLSNVKEESN